MSRKVQFSYDDRQDSMEPKIIVHGGAWTISEERREAHIAGCRSAVEKAYPMLLQGACALDAVQAAINVLEKDETFDAGRGAVLNADGQIELDAAIMDGRNLRFGAVAAIRCFMTPVDIARKVMDTEHCFLVGAGAERFARENGLKECDPRDLVVERELKLYEKLRRKVGYSTHEAFAPKPQGTVGAVAIDNNGNIAASTSTGGTPYKAPGRVGDSPVCGAGLYADNGLGGASCTGFGEGILRTLMCFKACDYLKRHNAPTAALKAIEMLHRRVNGHAGIILLDQYGNYGIYHNTDHMAHAYVLPDGVIHSTIHMDR